MSHCYNNIRFWLLNLILVTRIILTATELHGESALQEFIICRQCGADVADSYYLSNHLSPESIVHSNQTIFGKSDIKIQVLVNPYGIKFKVINTSKALCTGVGDWHNAHSWYPGFAWRHCVCPHCGTHLGWLFEPLSTAVPGLARPTEDGFYALIVDNILSEKFTDSLMVFPNALRS